MAAMTLCLGVHQRENAAKPQKGKIMTTRALSEPGADRGGHRHGGRGSAPPRRRTNGARDPEKIECRHQWRYGDFVIWDNRSVIHKANPDYDMNERRYLYPLMLKREAPVRLVA